MLNSKTYFAAFVMLLPAALLFTTRAQPGGSMPIASASKPQKQLADTMTVNRLNQQVGHALITGNADSLLQTAQTAVQLATQLQYKPGLAAVPRLTGSCYRLKVEYPVALKESQLRVQAAAGTADAGSEWLCTIYHYYTQTGRA